MLLIDLFGSSEIVVKCTSGEEMYEVASKAKKELNAINRSATIGSVIGHTFTRESVWKNSDYKWITIRDYGADGIHMFGSIASEEASYFYGQLISAEEYFNTFSPQPTIDEQEFSDLFQELVS